MGIQIGQVIGQRIGNYKSFENIRLLEVNLLGDFPDTVLFINIGEDSAPVNGDMVIVFDMMSFRFAVAAWDLITAVASAGERHFYSRNSSGAKQAILNLKDDGQIELNGTGDFAVRFNELETAFNQLKTDYDNLLNAVNNHVHGGVTAGSSSTSPLVTGLSPSTANISPAKIDEIEVPS